MSEKNATKSEKSDRKTHPDRRAALNTLVWAAPAVVATAAVKARAATASCPPDDVCGPDDF